MRGTETLVGIQIFHYIRVKPNPYWKDIYYEFTYKISIVNRYREELQHRGAGDF